MGNEIQNHSERRLSEMSQHSTNHKDIDNKELIKLVKERPPLYNTKLGEYSNAKLNEKLWMEVAKILNYPVKQCKQKWINVRNSYARYLRGKKDPNSRTKTFSKKYYLADTMAFLRPYMCERRRKEFKYVDSPNASTRTRSFPSGIKKEPDDEEQDNMTLILGDLNSDYESENSESEMFLKCETEMPEYYNTQFLTNSSQSHYAPDQSMTIDTTQGIRMLQEQENSFVDFAKSLVLDYSQLSVRRQRVFKQRMLTILNDLLDDQESEEVN